MLFIKGSIEGNKFISKLNAPSAYFVYCNLVEADQNLLTGKKRTLLAKFDILGRPFRKINYRAPKQQDGELFDFHGQELYFELRRNLRKNVVHNTMSSANVLPTALPEWGADYAQLSLRLPVGVQTTEFQPDPQRLWLTEMS